MSNQVKIISECNEMLNRINNLLNYLDKLNESIDLHNPYTLVTDIVGSMYDYDPDTLVAIIYHGIDKELGAAKEILSNKLPYLQQVLEIRHE